MGESDPVLTFISVPDECKAVAPFLDISSPAFNKTLKKIEKKFLKSLNTTNPVVRKTISFVHTDGITYDSDYELIGRPNVPDLLVARLPTSEGVKLQALSFINLMVQKKVIDCDTKESSAVSPSKEPAMEQTMNSFSSRLDKLLSVVSTIAERTSAPAAASEELLATPKAAARKRATNAGKQTPVTMNYKLLDETIDSVLNSVRSGSDKHLFEYIANHYGMNLSKCLDSSSNQLPTPKSILKREITSPSLEAHPSKRQNVAPDVTPNVKREMKENQSEEKSKKSVHYLNDEPVVPQSLEDKKTNKKKRNKERKDSSLPVVDLAEFMAAHQRACLDSAETTPERHKKKHKKSHKQRDSI